MYGSVVTDRVPLAALVRVSNHRHSDYRQAAYAQIANLEQEQCIPTKLP
jgi:hypothetical protein